MESSSSALCDTGRVPCGGGAVDRAPLSRFDRQGYHVACAHGVHAQPIAFFVQHDHILGLLDHAESSERVHGLVFRSVDLPAGVGSLQDGEMAAAADRAGRTGAVLDLRPRRVALRLERLAVGRPPARPVVGGECAGLVQHGDHHGRTQPAIRVGRRGTRSQAGHALADGVEGFTAFRVQGTGGGDGDRLQLLAPEHRAHAAAPQGVVLLQLHRGA